MVEGPPSHVLLHSDPYIAVTASWHSFCEVTGEQPFLAAQSVPLVIADH